MSFIPDETRPNLIDFTVDLDRRVVTLVFDETVSRTTLMFREITFTSSNASVSVKLHSSDSKPSVYSRWNFDSLLRSQMTQLMH